MEREPEKWSEKRSRMVSSVRECVLLWVHRTRGSMAGLFSLYKVTLRSLYFPDEMSIYFNYFVRAVFSMYYVPHIMMVFAGTHSALERVVWVLIVPITQEMERNPYNYSYWVTLMGGLWHIFLRMAPFAALGASVATIGHKLINCFAEAMMDAYTSQNGTDYPLMRARVVFITRKRSRTLAFAAVLTLLLATLFFVLRTDAMETWPLSSEPMALTGAVCIILIQALFVLITICHGVRPILYPGQEDGDSASTTPATTVETRSHTTVIRAVVTYVTDEWWVNTIGFMRYIAFVMVILYAGLLAASGGVFHGTTCAVLLLVYLNLPHLFGYVALSVASAIIRTVRPFFWLRRHPDAFLPFAVIVLPYQALLLNALVYFRRHPLTCAAIASVNVLLLARAVDLVREFDVSEHGSVHWTNAETGDLITPSLAIILEDAHEKKHRRLDVISLDLQVDLKHMVISYTDGKAVPLTRSQIIPYGAARRYLKSDKFYAYTVPRLFTLQSPGYFGGSKFRTTRVILRAVSLTMLLVYVAIVCGMLMQAAFPQLRPIPVRVTAPEDNSYLFFDHIVVRMYLLSKGAASSATVTAAVAAAAAQANATGTAAIAAAITQSFAGSYLTGMPEPAQVAFKWNNVSSPAGVDFYPQLCTRSYYGTSIWEMALLAVAPYLFNEDEFHTMLRFMNAHLQSDWVIRQRHGTSCVPGDSGHQPTGWNGFYDVYSKSRNTSIITVRGTDLFSFTDFLIDINLFFETVMYQFMSNMVPGTGLLPKEMVANLIRMASLPSKGVAKRRETWQELIESKDSTLRGCQQNNYGRDFFADVHNHITYIGSRPDRPENIVITGHSLGGSVAAIIAAQLDVKAVAFGTPGMVLARKKFGVELRDIHKNVMTIASSSDIMPLLGEQGGEVQHVECLASTRELCHAMEFLIGSLWRSCSSVRSQFPSIEDVV